MTLINLYGAPIALGLMLVVAIICHFTWLRLVKKFNKKD